jgi:hypothetical protein
MERDNFADFGADSRVLRCRTVSVKMMIMIKIR